MLKKVILILIISISPISLLAQYKLTFKGITQRDLDQTPSFAGKTSGTFSISKVDQIVRELYSSKNYSSLEAYKVNNNLIEIVADPIRTLNDVQFTGEHGFSNRELFKASQLKLKRVIDRQVLLDAGERIQYYLKEKGYLRAKVTAQIENSTITHSTSANYFIAPGQLCRIGSIKILTNSERLEKDLVNHLSSFIGTPCAEEEKLDVQTALNEYLSEERYFQAKMIPQPEVTSSNQEEMQLSYRITDSQRYEIVFDGNKEVSSLELYSILNLSSYERSSADPIGQILGRVINIYKDKGFAKVEVKHSIKVFPKKGTTWLKIAIKEGQKVRIDQLNFSGRISRPSKYYSKFIYQNSGLILFGGLYHEKELEKGLDNLMVSLRNEGFLKAKIISSRADFFNLGQNVNLNINIDEGPLTIVNKIDLVGLSAKYKAAISLLMTIKKNGPLNATLLEESLKDIEKYYKNHGHLEMKYITPKSQMVSINEEKRNADLKIEIYEGPSIRIKSIIISGNEFTKDRVIHRTIPIKVGMTLTPDLVEETNSNLRDLGIFNVINVDLIEKNTPLPERNLVINLKERDPGLIKFGVGVTDESILTVRGFAGISYNNIGGTARAVSFRGDLANSVEAKDYYTHKLTLGYLEPFIFGGKTKGRVNLTRLQELVDDSETVKESNKIAFSLERALGRNTKFTWTLWSNDSVRRFDLDSKETTSLDEVAIIGPTLEFDHRDSPFLPTKGFYARWNLDYSNRDLGSSQGIDFFKTTTSLIKYKRLLNRPDFVWANNLQGGYLENLSNETNSGIPKDYAFKLGGRSTLRGFSPDSTDDALVPDYVYEYIGDTPYITTQSSFFLFKSELRFPISGSLGGVLFYDAGAVYINEKDQLGIKIDVKDPFRQSAGFGFRINTPMGPASLEFAVKIDGLVTKPNGDKERASRVHFSFGTF